MSTVKEAWEIYVIIGSYRDYVLLVLFGEPPCVKPKVLATYFYFEID